jgi:uncharacterized protein YndB with AHSA1/START domain
MNATKITIHATIAANHNKVWECYTNPRHITKWNFASDDWHCPTAENDMQVGGKYRSRMEAKDGSWGFDFEATYDEVVDQEKFSYTMADGRQAITRFESHGDQTKVTITFDAESENSEDMQRDGWQAILNNFKKYVETN